MGNKIIVQRLVSGILLIFLSILVMKESIKLLYLEDTILKIKELETAAVWGVVLSIFIGITGILYSATCKEWPKRDLDIRMFLINITTIFSVSSNQNVRYFKDLIIFQIFFLIFSVLGMSYRKRTNNSLSKNKKVNKSKGAREKQLKELTEMLNDRNIAQNEFDTKQKNIEKNLTLKKWNHF